MNELKAKNDIVDVEANIACCKNAATSITGRVVRCRVIPKKRRRLRSIRRGSFLSASVAVAAET